MKKQLSKEHRLIRRNILLLLYFVSGLTFMVNVNRLDMNIRHRECASSQRSIQRVAQGFAIKGNGTTDDLGNVFVLEEFADIFLLILSLS